MVISRASRSLLFSVFNLRDDSSLFHAPVLEINKKKKKRKKKNAKSEILLIYLSRKKTLNDVYARYIIEIIAQDGNNGVSRRMWKLKMAATYHASYAYSKVSFSGKFCPRLNGIVVSRHSRRPGMESWFGWYQPASYVKSCLSRAVN